MSKPKVGDIILTKKIAWHRHDNWSVREELVTKVGRIYFHTDRGTAFEIGSYERGMWRDKHSGYGYGHEYRAYESHEEYEREVNRNRMIKALKNVDWTNFDNENLCKVHAVIFGEEANER